MRSIVVIILLLLSSCLSLSSQEVIEVITVEQDQGLQDRTVDRVIRDDRGYFVLFMLNTVQRYDGRAFTTIDASAINRANLTVRDLQMVDKLADGTIVMSAMTSDLLFFLETKSDVIKSVSLSGTPLVSKERLYVYAPADGEDGKPGLNLYQAEFGSEITMQLRVHISISGEVARLADTGRSLYVQMYDERIYHVMDDEIALLPVRGQIICNDESAYVFRKKDIMQLNRGHATVVADLPDSTHVCRILKSDDQGNIIAAYSSRPRFYDHLYVLDIDGVLHEMTEITKETDIFKDFHTDDAFYRWMLVGYNGVKVISLVRDGSRFIYRRPDIQKGEFGVLVSAVACDEDEVVFARELKGIFQYDKRNEAYAELYQKHRRSGALHRNAKLYFHPPSDAYYSHAYRYDGQSDLYKTDPSTGAVHACRVPIKVNDIFVREEDQLIIGGFASGEETGIVASYDMTTKSYKVLLETPRQVRSLYFHPQTEEYWVGLYAGLLIYSKDFELLHAVYNHDEPLLPIDHVILCASYAGKVIAGTYGGGVSVIDPVSYDVERHINSAEGLTDDSAVGIIADDLGYCWITTFNGVTVIDSTFDVVRKIYEHDGLPNREFNSKAIAKDADGVLFGGTLNGVAMLEPEKVMNWQKSFGVAVTGIIGHHGENAEVLEETTLEELYRDYDSIEITYFLPDYQVYPYVDELVDVTVKGADVKCTFGKITLTDIREDRLEVSIGPQGSTETTQVVFQRRPDYPRTLLTMGGILLAALITYLIFRSILRNTKRRETEKTAINKKMADLQLTSLQAQMNPHFIFNALGAVQYFIQTQDTEKADEYLSNFAMLMRSILESSKSRYIRLSEEIRLLELYIGLEKVRFEELFDYEIRIDEEVDQDINMPPMIIQPFVENAINHGLFNLKGRKGMLSLQVEYDGVDGIIITITDNGIGRAAAALLRMRKHKSRGMQLVKERLDTINSTSDLSIMTETTDRFDPYRNPMGTKVIIHMSGLYE